MSNQITPIPTSREQGLQTTRPIIFMIILLAWIVLTAATWPPPSLPTTQAGADARIAAQSDDQELSLEPGKPIERKLSAVNRISTR